MFFLTSPFTERCYRTLAFQVGLHSENGLIEASARSKMRLAMLYLLADSSVRI